MRSIRKAVIPAAGMGTRFLPATKSIPKEMIPIVDVPMIQLIVEEAVKSGLTEIVLITGRGKEAIERHFSSNTELESFLEEKGKKELAEVSRALGRMCNLIAVRQDVPMGLGHAVLCAAQAVGNEPFAVLLGDDLIDTTDAEGPCTGQLIKVAQAKDASVVGVMEVSAQDVSKYGIVAAAEDGRVTALVEKPDPATAPSRLAIPGRYILSPEIFKILENTRPGKGGEIQLTDALEVLARGSSGLYAAKFQGTRYDTGDRLGFIEATLAYALKRPELAKDVKGMIRRFSSALGIIAFGFGIVGAGHPSRVEAATLPGSYLLKTWVSKKNTGTVKTVRVRSAVTEMVGDRTTAAHFRVLTAVDWTKGILKARAYDDAGKELFVHQRVVGGTATGGESYSLAAALLWDSRVDLVQKMSKNLGMPVLGEKEPIEVARWRGLYVWTIGWDRGTVDSPQVWMEKDVFTPVRVVFKSEETNQLLEARLNTYRPYRELVLPSSILIMPPTGRAFEKAMDREEGFLREDINEVVVNPEALEWSKESPGPTAGFTKAGAETDAAVHALIERYFETLR